MWSRNISRPENKLSNMGEKSWEQTGNTEREGFNKTT